MTKLNGTVSYRELFLVKKYPEEHLRISVGVSADGRLLSVHEHIESAGITDMQPVRTFYLLTTEEYRAYYEKAKRNGKLEKAVKQGKTTFEEAAHFCG